MRKRVQMPDVVAFELKPRAAALTERAQNRLDIGEGVLENPAARLFEIRRFPILFPARVLVDERI